MPKEKIVIVGWNFVRFKCMHFHDNGKGKMHNPDMLPVQDKDKTYYMCADPNCTNRFPLAAYEKLQDNVIKVINSGVAERDYTWTIKISQYLYELKIFSYSPGKEIKIGINNLTLLGK